MMRSMKHLKKINYDPYKPTYCILNVFQLIMFKRKNVLAESWDKVHHLEYMEHYLYIIEALLLYIKVILVIYKTYR